MKHTTQMIHVFWPLKHRCISILLFFGGLLLRSSSIAAQNNKENGSHIQENNARQSGIQFLESSWNDALKKGEEEHKFIFVDAYASWCAPCKLLKSTTFHDKEAADFFNRHFINLSIDMEKGEGPRLATLWEIEAYPTLIIFDAKGKMVHGSVGFLKAKPLIKFAKNALAKSS